MHLFAKGSFGGVGVSHHTLEHRVNGVELLGGVGLEHSTIGTYLVFELAEDGTGDVATLHGFLVHIVIEGGRGGAEHTADVDVHNGRVGVVGGEVHTETAAKVVGGTHNGAQVGVALLAGIGHLGQLFGKHPEGEDVTQVALIEVGTPMVSGKQDSEMDYGTDMCGGGAGFSD